MPWTMTFGVSGDKIRDVTLEKGRLKGLTNLQEKFILKSKKATGMEVDKRAKAHNISELLDSLN